MHSAFLGVIDLPIGDKDPTTPGSDDVGGDERDFEEQPTAPPMRIASRQLVICLQRSEQKKKRAHGRILSRTRRNTRMSLISEDWLNIEKELNKDTALYTGQMASSPAGHHPQGPSGEHVLNVESEPSTHGNVCHSANRQLRMEAEVRGLRGLVENPPFSEATPPKQHRSAGSTLIFRLKMSSFGEAVNLKLSQ